MNLLEYLCQTFESAFEDNLQAQKYARNFIGLLDTQIKKFRIGFAPCQYFNCPPEFSNKEKVESGCFSEKGNLLFYDRLIYPIINIESNVIGFSGRDVTDRDERKWINSYNCEHYDKSVNFYNEKALMQDYFLIVEGAKDVVMLDEIGINALSTLGGSLSEIHIQKIISSGATPYLCYDNDVQGWKYTKQNALKLISAGVNPKIVIFNTNYECDPADIAAKGFEFWKKSRIVTTYKKLFIECCPDPPQKVIEQKNLLLAVLSIENEIERNEFIAQIADDFDQWCNATDKYEMPNIKLFRIAENIYRCCIFILIEEKIYTPFEDAAAFMVTDKGTFLGFFIQSPEHYRYHKNAIVSDLKTVFGDLKIIEFNTIPIERYEFAYYNADSEVITEKSDDFAYFVRSKSFSIDELNQLCKWINDNEIDFLPNYSEWYRAGQCLADVLGENGLIYFQKMSENNADYSPLKTENQFKYCLRFAKNRQTANTQDVNFSYIFNLANLYYGYKN